MRLADLDNTNASDMNHPAARTQENEHRADPLNPVFALACLTAMPHQVKGIFCPPEACCEGMNHLPILGERERCRTLQRVALPGRVLPAAAAGRHLDPYERLLEVAVACWIDADQAAAAGQRAEARWTLLRLVQPAYSAAYCEAAVLCLAQSCLDDCGAHPHRSVPRSEQTERSPVLGGLGDLEAQPAPPAAEHLHVAAEQTAVAAHVGDLALPQLLHLLCPACWAPAVDVAGRHLSETRSAAEDLQMHAELAAAAAAAAQLDELVVADLLHLGPLQQLAGRRPAQSSALARPQCPAATQCSRRSAAAGAG